MKRDMAPTLFTSRAFGGALPLSCLMGAVLARGGPSLRSMTPTLVASRAFGDALPLSCLMGAELAWGGPAENYLVTKVNRDRGSTHEG